MLSLARQACTHVSLSPIPLCTLTLRPRALDALCSFALARAREFSLDDGYEHRPVAVDSFGSGGYSAVIARSSAAGSVAHAATGSFGSGGAWSNADSSGGAFPGVVLYPPDDCVAEPVPPQAPVEEVEEVREPVSATRSVTDGGECASHNNSDSDDSDDGMAALALNSPVVPGGDCVVTVVSEEEVRNALPPVRASRRLDIV